MTKEKIEKAIRVLVDNGMDKGEAFVVLQALCYVLMDSEVEDFFKDNIKDTAGQSDV